MQKNSIFDFENYKNYILFRIKNSPRNGRGLKLKMAETLKCQSAFISQVLNSDPNFSLEQAIGINKFFGHNKEEARFFLLLLQLERAATRDLKEFFKEEIKEVINKRSDLKNRIDIKSSLKNLDQQIYYSNWLYACIHMLVAIPEFQTLYALEKYLRIPREKIIDVLNFLENTGIIQKINGHYKIGVTRIHLSKDSPQIQRHHTNWRMKAIQSIDMNIPEDLHFSTIVSISNEDVPKIKEKLIKCIEECRTIIKDSKEETVQCLCLDFFKI